MAIELVCFADVEFAIFLSLLNSDSFTSNFNPFVYQSNYVLPRQEGSRDKKSSAIVDEKEAHEEGKKRRKHGFTNLEEVQVFIRFVMVPMKGRGSLKATMDALFATNDEKTTDICKIESPKTVLW